MSIFPQGYEVPKAESRYMKFEFKENMFRILSEALVGYEYWVDVPDNGNGKATRKPIRVKTINEVPDEYRFSGNPQKKPKAFMAFKVFNYDTNGIQILEITQKSIMRDIQLLDMGLKWGDVRGYDLTISKIKTGSGQTDVEYSVMPNPKSPVDPEIQKLSDSTNVNLSALWTGGDPFADVSVTDQDIEDFEKSLKK